MAQILAIDYGKARCGIAVTDDLQMIASALETVPTNLLIGFLERYFAQNKVEIIVIGLPLDLRGNFSEVESEILDFIRLFNEKFPKIQVKRIDERYTSKMASFFISQSGKNKKKREEKGLIDRVSATIILQSFLEKENK